MVTLVFQFAVCDAFQSEMKEKVLFVFVVHEDCLIIKSFSPVWSDFSGPSGSWEYIDLQRVCTYSKLSGGNEAKPGAIF